MKTTLSLALVAGLMATSAAAGGLSPPVWMEPPVTVLTPAPSKAGFYGGIQGGQSETSTYRYEEETLERGDYCLLGESENCYGTGYTEGDWTQFFGNPILNALPTKGSPEAPGHCGGMTIDCVTGRDKDGNATDIWVNDGYTFATVDETEVTSDSFVGAFFGYRDYVSGNVMAGVEGGAYIHSEAEDPTLTGEAVVWYDGGQIMPFISAGGVKRGDMSGWTAGLGADFSVTESMFVGAKYSVNEFEDNDVTDNNFAIRVGWNFN